MRKGLFSIFLFVQFVIIGCTAGAQQATIKDADAPPVTAVTVSAMVVADRPLYFYTRPDPEYRRALVRGTRSEDGRPGERYWQQYAQYDLSARLEPGEKKLYGSGSITYRNNSPDTLSNLYLELAQNLHREGGRRSMPAQVTGGVEMSDLKINKVTYPSSQDAGTGSYMVDGTTMRVSLIQPVLPDSQVTLNVRWSFVIPQKGADARMGYSGNNVFFVAYWYPQMMVYDDVVGWFKDPFLGQAEFYSGFADYRVSIDIPQGWTVHGTGRLANASDVLQPEVLRRLQSASESDTPVRVVSSGDFGRVTLPGDNMGYLRWHYVADKVRDFAFSATSESVWTAARTRVGDRDDDGTEDYTLINSVYRESAPLWSEVTKYQQHSISFLSRFTGKPYPWPHMTAVEGGGIISGGMEFPMMTLIGDYSARGDTALYNVTVHELAHMWLPMMLSNNERRYSWIDEGTTTYHENQARKDFYPGIDHDLGDQNRYVAITRASAEGPMMRRSDQHYGGEAFTVASYSKPAAALSALEVVIGQSVFRQALREFIDSWAYKHPYPNDFFNTFERVSGMDLDWFWRSWYYETWVLDQAVADVRSDRNMTTVTIADVGEIPMPVLLSVQTERGTVVTKRIEVGAWLRGQTSMEISVETDSKPVRVTIDPERHFPDADRTNNEWVSE